TRPQDADRLASVQAPAIIASFGSGQTRTDIRLVPPEGTARYRAVQRAALRARKAADAQLLTNSNITFSATARKQLLSGDIDPRLPLLLAAMASHHPLPAVASAASSPPARPATL